MPVGCLPVPGKDITGLAGPESGRLEEEASTSSPKMAARGHGGPGTFWVSLGLV